MLLTGGLSSPNGNAQTHANGHDEEHGRVFDLVEVRPPFQHDDEQTGVESIGKSTGSIGNIP